MPVVAIEISPVNSAVADDAPEAKLQRAVISGEALRRRNSVSPFTS